MCNAISARHGLNAAGTPRSFLRMRARTMLWVLVASATTALGCNPVSPVVDYVDGTLYTRPNGGALDGGVDGAVRDAGTRDGGPRDAAGGG